jgi:hypothetical protein
MTIIRWMRRTTTGRCRIWVNRVTLTTRHSLPVFPEQQTSAAPVGMSQTCHQRTHAPQKIASLFDHLVGDSDQRRRYFYVKPWLLELYDEVELALRISSTILNSRRQQDLPTGRWQLRQGYWWSRLLRRRWLPGMNDRICEPISEIGR